MPRSPRRRRRRWRSTACCRSGWIGLVGALQGPIPGAQYFHIRDPPRRPSFPTAPCSWRPSAPDRAAHVTGALRKSRFYEDLRTAMLADAAANGGQVDPRLAANLQRARLLPTTRPLSVRQSGQRRS